MLHCINCKIISLQIILTVSGLQRTMTVHVNELTVHLMDINQHQYGPQSISGWENTVLVF